MRTHLIALSALGVTAVSPTASASVIEIAFQFLDLEYDGSVITTPGGLPDELDAVTFRVDGVTVGTITTDVFADVAIPVVLPAPSSIPGSSTATSGTGDFDLTFGTEFLDLTVDEVEVTYFDSGSIKFVFGAEVGASIDGQSLPFGLELADPIEVSFSTQIDSGDFTGFTASGTGEVQGVPEPSAMLLALAALGVAVAPTRRRAR
ncbi:MAG: hypothetical protein AAFY08_00950 [Planctomycetota bacterium]